MTSKEYIDQLNKFSRTIETKSNHKVIIYKNKLSSTLNTEYKMLKKINDLKLTPENTEVVRSMLNRVFDKLITSGIDFD